MRFAPKKILTIAVEEKQFFSTTYSPDVTAAKKPLKHTPWNETPSLVVVLVGSPALRPHRVRLPRPGLAVRQDGHVVALSFARPCVVSEQRGGS